MTPRAKPVYNTKRPHIESAIIDLLKVGDNKGYELLFHHYHKRLFKKAYQILKEKETAEDAVQDVFINLLASRAFNRINGSLASYLESTIKNTSLNLIISRNRERKRLVRYKILQQVRDTSTDYDTIINEYNLIRAINTLPSQCKEVITLIFLQRKKYKDAAAILGVSVNTIKTQLRRGILKLRSVQ